MIEVKIINKSSNILPQYETVGSAAMDIRAFIVESTSNVGSNSIHIQPGETKVIPTGLYVSIETGYALLVQARSGLSAKHGIMIGNGVGLIDEDYRGEIGAILYNGGKFPFVVNNGDRIAQLRLVKVPKLKWNSVTSLDDTERGSGGFGSTGV